MSRFQDSPLFQATATSSTTASPCWQVCAQGTPALCSNAIVIQGWLSQSGLANNLPTRLLDTVPPACEQAGLTQLSGCSFASCRISGRGSMRTEQKSYRGLNTATMRQGQLVGPAVCWCYQARRPAWTLFMRLKLDDTALWSHSLVVCRPPGLPILCLTLQTCLGLLRRPPAAAACGWAHGLQATCCDCTTTQQQVRPLPGVQPCLQRCTTYWHLPAPSALQRWAPVT